MTLFLQSGSDEGGANLLPSIAKELDEDGAADPLRDSSGVNSDPVASSCPVRTRRPPPALDDYVLYTPEIFCDSPCHVFSQLFPLLCSIAVKDIYLLILVNLFCFQELSILV